MRNGGEEEEQPALAKALRRLDALVEALEDREKPASREVAREMLELVLDLHGLALARILSHVAQAKDGHALTGLLAEDAAIRAILLLHGLHPDDPETRLRKVIAAMHPHWGVRGARVEILNITSRSARVHIHLGTSVDDSGRKALLREIEDALIDAAPDLDDIILEGVGQAETPRISASAMGA